MIIAVYDRDYETLKAYEAFLRCLNSKAELCFFTAVSLLKEGIRGKPPEVIFAEADGSHLESLMKNLKELAPKAKIILVSTSAYSAQDALNIGASGYLIKPITKEKLQQKLQYIGIIKNALNSLFSKQTEKREGK